MFICRFLWTNEDCIFGICVTVSLSAELKVGLISLYGFTQGDCFSLFPFLYFFSDVKPHKDTVFWYYDPIWHCILFLILVECRKRRRKCVWHRYSLVCQRCAQRDIECVPIDDHNSSLTDDDDARSEDGDQDLQQWINDILQLQHTAQQLETTLDRIRSDIIDPSWTFHIVNDQLRLESGNVNLFQYGEACFRYLSPFAALFHKEPVTFECAALHNLLEGFRLVSQLKLEHNTAASMTTPLLTEPCIDFEKMMDTLVHFYIHDHPPQVLPILHIPSYDRHYKSLRDKMACPITLAICVNAASSPMLPMKGYTAKERRAIGDFFFHRCHEVLFDIFDDPERRLDVLTTISLLYHYLSVVRLWFTEARRLATIALCICDDIQRSGLELTPIQHAMFQRQHLQSRYVMHFLDLVMHQAYINEEDLFNVEPFAMELEILEDESNTVEWNIKAINHVSRLCLSPYFLLIMVSGYLIQSSIGISQLKNYFQPESAKEHHL